MIDIIDILITVAKVTLAALPFFFLCLLGKKVNLTKSDRSKQFLMPVIAVIYSIIALLLLDRINSWLIGLLDLFVAFMRSLCEIEWMPELLGDAANGVADFLTPYLRSLNLSYWLFCISNAAIILAYIFIKKICISVMSRAVKTDGKFHSRIAGNFYEFFPEKDKWCLREDYVQVRSFLKTFYYAAVVLSTVLMMVSRHFYYRELMRSVFYPVFGIIIVGELFFYLDGATKREYTENILFEDEDAYKVANYSLLRKFLRSVFGDKLLTENTSINSALSYDVTTEEIIDELAKSEDPKIVNFAAYVDALNKTGFPIDHNYLQSSLDMLCGESILFNNPFYNDLIPYAFYPMNRALLAHQKVLVVLGRHSIEDDIKEWLGRGIEAVTNIPFLWNIGILNRESQDLDIGIITRSDVLDIKMHNANSEFLEKVSFFIVIEPSKLLSTAQIGLNLIVKKCKAEEDKKIVYCLCDKNCDGLVDAMSHVLMTSITEVSATQKHLGTSSYMCWEADEDYLHHRLVPNISRYLGMGTELSFAALKNQVSKTKWYGGDAFPVTDIRWISKQYYYDLTNYANIPTSQESMDERFITSPNFWSAEVESNNYFTVEDESYNMFEILRDFSTRTDEQGFINVISSEYLLKDYMADNASIFEADAKAIPFIVADYTRSNRNTILRLILMMSTYPVSTDILEKEFSLLGISVYDLKKQIWYELYNCYAKVVETAALPDHYEEAVKSVYSRSLVFDGVEFTHEIIKISESFNMKLGRMETVFAIHDPAFLKICVSELKSAGYVAEDERGQRYYLGAELSGHIYQKYLPGQFFTFGGKYYEMQYLTADGQILIRRAADHITGRPTYRQIRRYTIHGVRESEKIGAQQNIAGLKVVREFADISVRTPGYYRMEKYNDFSSAKSVLFEGEKSGIPERVYHNKEILRIELPDFDGRLNDNIRYTITALFNEVFRTIFAENQAYICAVTGDDFTEASSAVGPLTYSVEGDGYELHRNAIYIIEDSQLDLGLTVAVDRNLQRIFSIIHDYIDWHMEALEASLSPMPDPKPPIVFNDPEEEETPKKKGLIRRFFSAIGSGIKRFFGKIKGLFKRKKKKDKDKDAEVPEVDPADSDADFGSGDPTPKTPAETPDTERESETDSGEKAEPGTDEDASDDQDDIDEEEFIVEDGETSGEADDPDECDGDPADAGEGSEREPADTTVAPAGGKITYSAENERVVTHGFSTERKPYHERYYILYGYEDELPFIDLSGTLGYLAQMGIQHNSLKQAREGKKIAELVEATFKPGKPDARYCDFCGNEIYGVEYETLSDGRNRCLNCGRTAIKTAEEFRRVFEDVKRNMESFYGIRINAGIKVEMVNSKKLHKRLGKTFTPTPKSDGRVIGVAIKDRDGYTLMVENGAPRMSSMLTMAHELTHIWQYLNWNDRAIRKKYGKKLRLEIYEGMAKWVEIQYAYLINEPAVAKREEIITSYRDDEYGRGFLRYLANYPFSTGTVITKKTPFMDVETPLDLEYCGSFTLVRPTDGGGQGDHDGTDRPTGNDRPTPTRQIKGTIERKPGGVRRYAYELLDAGEKSVYDVVLGAINDFRDEITDIPGSLTDVQAQRIVDYVQRDHPEIFWFQHGATYFFDAATHIVSRITFEYCMTREEAKKRGEKIEMSLKAFLSSINDSMSDYEVTLRVYENIIGLVDYDTVGLERQTTTVVPGVPDDLRSIYGVFVNKRAVCAGYAKATQYLLNLCGIECAYVTSDTHAWNLVKLEGDYYHLDTTWGDLSNTKKDNTRAGEIVYDCFCITSKELSRLESHTPTDIMMLPDCTATKCNYHRRQGLFFETYDFARVRNIVSESVAQNRFDISVKFVSQSICNEAKRDLIDNGKLREIIQFANLKSSSRVSGSFSYSTNENIFTITFYLKKL